MKTLALLLLLVPATVVRTSMGGDIDVPEAPNGARLRTMGGDIRVDRAGGHVIAKTMGGDIEVRDLHGSILASTMGGEVDVTVTGTTEGATFRLTSLGGEIQVTFPADFSGTFEVELEQDDDDRERRIVSDFPLQIKESRKDRWFRSDARVYNATGRSGSGTHLVRIKTVGGDIVIRKR